jgi:hypothetical protein
MTHETFNAATACCVPQAAQGCMDSGYAISAAMGQMEPADLGKQDAIGRLAGCRFLKLHSLDSPSAANQSMIVV